MTETLKGIVLDIRKHSDRSNVVTLFTRERGRVAFISPIGSGRNARLRAARLRPLALIETEVNFRPSAELQTLRSFSSLLVADSLCFNPVKSAVTMFLAEFFTRLLRTSAPDPLMWDFLADSISLYNASRLGAANFHIALLISLLPITGIQPELSNYSPGMAFDMNSGSFVETPLHHHQSVGSSEASFIPLLARMNFANYHLFRLNGLQRRRILSLLIEYYALHMPGLGSLKSPEVLADLFSPGK